jgi:hypothetical protein
MRMDEEDDRVDRYQTSRGTPQKLGRGLEIGGSKMDIVSGLLSSVDGPRGGLVGRSVMGLDLCSLFPKLQSPNSYEK